MINFLRKRPMLFLAIFLTISVLLVYYSFFSALVFAAVCIAVTFYINYKKLNGILILSTVLLLITMLSAAHTLNDIDRISKLNALTDTGEYLVISESEDKGDYYFCQVEVIKSNYLEKGDKLKVSYQGAQIKEGQSFRAKIKISDMTSSPYKLSYYSIGVYAFGDVSNIVLTNNSDFVLTAINSVKTYIKTTIFKKLSYDEAATTLAVLTGDRGYLNDNFYSNIKNSGVMHVMVVSGMHLSIIVSFALYIVNKFLYNRYLKAFVIFTTVFAVAAICGFTMSILRAGITYLLYSLALVIGRESKSENNLGTAVCITLIINPLAIFSVGFQLSVLSTFGILCVAIPVIEFIAQNNLFKFKALNALVSMVLISLSAMLLTLPVLAFVYGYISNMTLIVNMLISLPITLLLCICILGLVFFPIGSLFFYVANWLVKYVNFVINYFGSNEFAITKVPQWSANLAAVIIFLILFGLVACTKQKNVLKLKEVINKKFKESGGRVKWPSLTKKS